MANRFRLDQEVYLKNEKHISFLNTFTEDTRPEKLSMTFNDLRAMLKPFLFSVLTIMCQVEVLLIC